jgi:hypothetical protein
VGLAEKLADEFLKHPVSVMDQRALRTSKKAAVKRNVCKAKAPTKGKASQSEEHDMKTPETVAKATDTVDVGAAKDKDLLACCTGLGDLGTAYGDVLRRLPPEALPCAGSSGKHSYTLRKGTDMGRITVLSLT